MLDRNRRIKRCPERFQTCKERFDIIVTVEERVYDQVSILLIYYLEVLKIVKFFVQYFHIFFQVIDFMESQEPVYNQPVHLINLEVQDNHEDATIGAFLICDMITMVKYIIEKYLNSKSTLSERNTETGHANSRKRRYKRFPKI